MTAVLSFFGCMCEEPLFRGEVITVKKQATKVRPEQVTSVKAGGSSFIGAWGSAQA
ncbi:MAG: hypothetical protein HYV63_07280 [Candidatus Schekmanbacteria bacterium]|nr:hypothetical protein [Candidatus Schekmanbacteria bacterium]